MRSPRELAWELGDSITRAMTDSSSSEPSGSTPYYKKPTFFALYSDEAFAAEVQVRSEEPGEEV